MATGTTGQRIADACLRLAITRMKSGPLRGDQQIGALIAEGKIDALIFFVDPLTPMPHDVDVKALTRLATAYDLPMALNPATAELLMKSEIGWRAGAGNGSRNDERRWRSRLPDPDRRYRRHQ